MTAWSSCPHLSACCSPRSAISGEMELAGCCRSTLLPFAVVLLKLCIDGIQTDFLCASVWSTGLVEPTHWAQRNSDHVWNLEQIPDAMSQARRRQERAESALCCSLSPISVQAGQRLPVQESCSTLYELCPPFAGTSTSLFASSICCPDLS